MLLVHGLGLDDLWLFWFNLIKRIFILWNVDFIKWFIQIFNFRVCHRFSTCHRIYFELKILTIILNILLIIISLLDPIHHLNVIFLAIHLLDFLHVIISGDVLIAFTRSLIWTIPLICNRNIDFIRDHAFWTYPHSEF